LVGYCWRKEEKSLLFFIYRNPIFIIMAELDITSILYISFRLAPFILVSFFSLASIINQDIKGLIYLIGLLIASAVAIIFGNTFDFAITPSSPNTLYDDTTRTCNLLTLTKTGPLSKLPLSQVVFSYTFGYLMYIIGKYKLASQNIPTIIIFPLLILFDWLWMTNNNCASSMAVFLAMIVGGSVGAGWSALIDSLKLSKYQYFSGLSTKETCSLAANQSFKCRKSSVQSA